MTCSWCKGRPLSDHNCDNFPPEMFGMRSGGRWVVFALNIAITLLMVAPIIAIYYLFGQSPWILVGALCSMAYGSVRSTR